MISYGTLQPFRLRRIVNIALLFFALVGCTSQNSDYKDRVVLRVNKAELSAEAFAEQLAERLKLFNALSAKDSAVVAQAKNAIIQDFVVQVVTQEWATANQVFVRKELLDAEVAKVRQSYPDDIAFRTALANEGLSYSKWEDRLKHTLLERLVLDTLRKDFKPVPESALLSLYQKNKTRYQRPAAVRLRQVVLSNEADAERIKKELASVKTLASLATKFSVTADSATSGDVGWIEKGQFEIFDVAFRMSVGQRSGVVKSPFGYHIFEVTDRRPAKTLSFEEARKSVEREVLAAHEQEHYSLWLEGLILKARVFKDDEFLKQIKVQSRGTK
jgi:peptidyl-prolyl cis-trans isomerase C